MPKRRLPDKDFIWTPELAYAVGLLVTDGNISSNGRMITLVSKDLEMLENFKACLGISNTISEHHSGKGVRNLRIQYGNVQFYDWLLKIGLTPAKSKTIGPIAIPDDFFRDYFRGCIDGNGSIQTYQDEYNIYKGRYYTTQRLFIKLVSASEKHIIWLQNRLEILTGIHGFITHTKAISENRGPIWGLKFAKKKSLKLIEWMYYSPEVPCLKRKRDIAEQAIEIIKNQKRRPYSRI